MKDTIVVIGSSNVDMIMKVGHFPTLGETVTGGKFNQVYGGKGANQAVGAARAGGQVAFVSSVGDDVFGPPMTRNFRDDGINTNFIFKETGVPCGTALIMIDDKGDNIITVAAGANEKLTPEHLETAGELIRGSEIIVLQNEVPIETVEKAIRMANESGVKVIYNLAPAREINPDLFNKIDYLVLNEVETNFLTGVDIDSIGDAKKAATKLIKKGIKTVIITLGSKGSYISSEEFEGQIEAFKVEVVDTTAAGDVFCGSLAVALNEGKKINNAVKFATAASALSVTKLGAQPSAPTRMEIDNLLGKQNGKY